MFKPAYDANGCITAPLINSSNTALVPTAVYNYLVNLLSDPEDWTYLKIGTQATGFEIVKVLTPMLGALVIVRAQDGTTAHTFAVNTPFAYELTALAIADIVDNASSFAISISGVSPINVEDTGDGNWEVSIDPLLLTSNNDTVVITGDYPEFDLAVSPNANGCC